MIERTFDARPSLDPRNVVDYPIRPLLAGVTKPRSYTWRCQERLDQGSEGSCVGHGWAHELAARPAVIPGITHETAVDIYQAAQQVDEWLGEEYEGTSVNAGAKILRDRGYLNEWRWATSVEDVVLTVGYRGPVVLGVPWFREMFETDPDGFIHPNGDLLGWHCVILHAVKVDRIDPDFTVLTGVNSWGSGWGDGGRFRLTARALKAMLDYGGEACVPTQRRKPKTS